MNSQQWHKALPGPKIEDESATVMEWSLQRKMNSLHHCNKCMQLGKFKVQVQSEEVAAKLSSIHCSGALLGNYLLAAVPAWQRR